MPDTKINLKDTLAHMFAGVFDKQVEEDLDDDGKVISAYLYQNDIDTINELLDYLGAHTNANRSHILRAGIHALSMIPKRKVHRLVSILQQSDKRRK